MATMNDTLLGCDDSLNTTRPLAAHFDGIVRPSCRTVSCLVMPVFRQRTKFTSTPGGEFCSVWPCGPPVTLDFDFWLWLYANEVQCYRTERY